MSNNHFLDVIHVWAAVAWADGVIADAEKLAMGRLIETAPLSDEERATANSWLVERVEFEGDHLASLSHESRVGVYRAAARLAAVDQDVAAEEKTFLGRLRDALGLEEAEARQIESGIPGHS